MLRYRVIPIVLLDGYSVVKTIRFDVRRNLGNPIVVARVYESRNVDELIFLDIDASKQNRGIDLYTIEAVASECFMPLTIGGGLRSCQDIANALKAGADKISLNSIIFERPEFLKEAVSTFGSQCIVASVDVKKSDCEKHSVFSHAGRRVQFSLKEYIGLLMRYKVGEILLNNVDLDGTMQGFDLALIEYVCSMTNIPVIVAGGASRSQDCAAAVQAGAQAVAASSIFHFTSITPKMCKEAMGQTGIPVRL